MFRFEEDAFLRKGGDYSRNCLLFEDEIEEEKRFNEDEKISRFRTSIPATLGTKAKVVFVSAGGYATETLVKALVEGSEYHSPSIHFGKYYLNKDNNSLEAFICPSARKSPSEPAYLIGYQEHVTGKWILSNCDENSRLLVFSTISARDQGDFSLRKLDNGFGKDDEPALKKIKWLEDERLVTSYAAAIMEAATLNHVPCTLILAPREPVLSKETLDILLGISLKLNASKSRLGPQAQETILTAIKLDERDQRRFEPEGHKIKIRMADALLKTVLECGPNAESSLAQLKLMVAKGEVPNRGDCRRIFEAGCFLAVARKDKAALERNLAQLRPYGMTDDVFALYLLLLLVGSRLPEFFALLETWDREKAPSQHIDFVVSLERNLTEGSYHTALRARKNSTSPYFVWLLEDLEHTVRDEVASCMEVSHKSVSLQKAAELLNLESVEAVRRFAETRPDWTVENGFIVFPSRNQVKALAKESIPAEWTTRQCLNMAVELDRIV